MPTIHTRIEGSRGCGYKKEGGKYFVCDGAAISCGMLPVELTSCPVCHGGIHFSRAFQWITTKLFSKAKCKSGTSCMQCIFTEPNTKMGLIWIGEGFYKTSEHFMKESRSMGISRRFAQLPKNFKLGETWIALAHRKAIPVIKKTTVTFKPGVFSAFKPTRLEYVVTGKETEAQLERLEKQGFTLIKVIRDIDAQTEITINETNGQDDTAIAN